MRSKVKKILTHGATLLALSAIGSKFLSLYRDRLVFQIFKETTLADTLFASFRIPDFFFFLLVTSTISVIFVPRIEKTPEPQREDYLWSFLSYIGLSFGLLSLLCVLFMPWIVEILFPSMNREAQDLITLLSRTLFASNFFLALNAPLSGYLQWRERFLTVSLGPLLYMGGVAGGLYFFGKSLGPISVSLGAIVGSFSAFCINLVIILKEGLFPKYRWKTPESSWVNFSSDFTRRMLGGAAFQINQTVDIVIAGLLIPGAIAAFSTGTALGQFLMSVVGFSFSNALFPKLSRAKNFKEQWPIMKKGIQIMLGISIPATIASLILMNLFLTKYFNLEGNLLQMTESIFQYTVLSLPFACLIPLFSRGFLALNDSKTPLLVTYLALGIATGFIILFSGYLLEGSTAVKALGIGNAIANILSASLFAFFYFRRYHAVT